MASGKTKKTTRAGKPTRRVRANQKTVATAPKRAPSKVRTATLVDTTPPLQRRWYQRTPKAERPVRPKLPNVWQLTKLAYRLLARNWKMVVGIALVYGVLNVLLVRGLNGGLNVSELKDQFQAVYKGGWGNLASGFTVFALLVSSSSSGTASDAAGAYQTFLVLITSLALVWNFRQVLAEKLPRPQLRVRDAFYRGMYPLVPVILVVLILSLQLIPLLIGGFLFSTVVTNGIAITGVEIGLWLAIFMASILWSVLLIIPTIFGLYIVSLPDMTPLKALRSAKTLVRFRRLTVLRKLLFLPLLVAIILSAIILPIIFTVPGLAQWVFFGISMFILPAVHAYLYSLYRELLNE